MTVAALFVADLHLSLKCPRSRLAERDWLSAMDRSLGRLRRLQTKHDCPVLVAGDIFDHWNEPAELINWALEKLPRKIWAIPGNHDLPSHRKDLSHRSAYGTLVRSGRLRELGTDPTMLGPLAVYGRPFGEEVPVPGAVMGLNVLVTHEYLWTSGTGYRGAPAESRLAAVAKSFRDYDLVIVGDNHTQFERRLKSGTFVVNCGAFLRRKTSERDQVPRIGMIHASGRVSFSSLEDSEEKWASPQEESETEWNASKLGDFVEALDSLESAPLDYADNLRRAAGAKGIAPEVKSALLEALDS